MGWDFFEIQPERPYTKADIRWTNPFSRCNKEKLGKREVPVKGTVDHFDQYDAVLIGFPIWYGCAPNVVNTFCSGYDFTGKKVALFATSGGSGIIFEQEGIDTRQPGHTLQLNLATAVAQTESESLSENLKWLYKKRAEKGYIKANKGMYFGYNTDDGNFKPDENAVYVRKMFREFADEPGGDC